MNQIFSLATCLPTKGDENLSTLILPELSTIYLGLDSDIEEKKVQKLKEQLKKSKMEKVFFPKDLLEKPIKICHLYNCMANLAYEDGHTYFVLWGDDIKTLERNWVSKVHERFCEYYKRGFPEGFGCVALRDITSPGFPTFPVVHRRHIKLFGGFCPQIFINQDSDPFIDLLVVHHLSQ
jgi:hypothetical protein